MKVGDKVRIIEHAYNGDEIGDIGIVIELVEETKKPDIRFDIQKIMLENHNFRYDAYMETRDEILEKGFAKRREVAQNVYDELKTEERIRIGL